MRTSWFFKIYRFIILSDISAYSEVVDDLYGAWEGDDALTVDNIVNRNFSERIIELD